MSLFSAYDSSSDNEGEEVSLIKTVVEVSALDTLVESSGVNEAVVISVSDSSALSRRDESHPDSSTSSKRKFFDEFVKSTVHGVLKPTDATVFKIKEYLEAQSEDNFDMIEVGLSAPAVINTSMIYL